MLAMFLRRISLKQGQQSGVANISSEMRAFNQVPPSLTKKAKLP